MSGLRELGLVLVASCAATAVNLPAAHAAEGFSGRWAATDRDGSTLALAVHGSGPRYAVREVDDAATVCGGAPASVSGAGMAEGHVLVVRAALACAPGGNVFRQQIEISFSYDATADVLTDNDGVVWSRVG
jgi:hypothetical protein